MMFKKRLNSLLFIIFSIITVAPQLTLANKQTEDIVIINYGIFAHSPDNGKTWLNPVGDEKIKGTSSSPVHLKTTRSIPAKMPLFFGFEYQLNNIEEKIITIDVEVNHPKMTLPDGSQSIGYRDQNKFLVLNGKITAINGFLLENESELAAGTWTFKIKRDGKKLIEQEFQLVSK